MYDIIINIVNNWGYLGVAFLIAIENIFPPIPSELILTFGGFLTIESTLTPFGVIIASTVGSLIGAFFLYAVGRLFSMDRLERIVEGKIGKILRLKKQNIMNAEKWFNKKGSYTVFFCRFIPIVRSLISIPAGMAKMNLFPFTLLTFIGSFIWNTVLVLLGVVFGNNYEMVVKFFKGYSKTIIFFVFVVLVIKYLYNKNKYKIKVIKDKI